MLLQTEYEHFQTSHVGARLEMVMSGIVAKYTTVYREPTVAIDLPGRNLHVLRFARAAIVSLLAKVGY